MTSSVIADAVAHIKQDKTDPIFNFCSDCFKNAPEILYDQLAAIFRGNICSSDNYHSIAISSLILKIFDWVIILLYGNKLCLDQL